eukprot:748567_1
MSSTYEEVNNSAKVNVDYYRWSVCYAKCNTFTILPPPFEFPITLICFFVRRICSLCKCSKQEFNLPHLICYSQEQQNRSQLLLELDARSAPWICRYCAALNIGNHGMHDIIGQIGDSKLFPFPKPDIKLIHDLNVRSCQHCHRIKKKANMQNVMESIVSFYLFILVLAPLRIVTFVIQIAVLAVFIVGHVVYCVCCCCCKYNKCCIQALIHAHDGLFANKQRNAIEKDWKVNAEVVQNHFDQFDALIAKGFSKDDIAKVKHAHEAQRDLILPVSAIEFVSQDVKDLGKEIVHGTDAIFVEYSYISFRLTNHYKQRTRYRILGLLTLVPVLEVCAFFIIFSLIVTNLHNFIDIPAK